jgi:hypothetical protein
MHRRNGVWSLPALRRSDLRDQQAPACGEEPALLRKRDVGLTAAVDSEVLPQLVERGTEPRRRGTPEAEHGVVAPLHGSMALLGVVVEVVSRPARLGGFSVREVC